MLGPGSNTGKTRVLLGGAAALALAACGVSYWARRSAIDELSAAAARQGATLRYAKAEGTWGSVRLSDVAFELPARVRARAPYAVLGYLPGRRFLELPTLALELEGAPDLVLEELQRIQPPIELRVGQSQLEWHDRSLGNLSASGVHWMALSAQTAVSAESVRIGELSLGSVHGTLAKPSSAVELRLGDAQGSTSALELDFVPRPGQGNEWTLTLPSQPFSEFAKASHMAASEGWNNARLAGTGSLVIPESEHIARRAHLRLIVDGWSRTGSPAALALTGPAGAIALYFKPSSSQAWEAPRVEVETGVFSLSGHGQLTFAGIPELRFTVSGRRRCSELIAQLPPSADLERLRAFMTTAAPAEREQSLGLVLDGLVKFDSASPPQLRFHLEPGCGLADAP